MKKFFFLILLLSPAFAHAADTTIKGDTMELLNKGDTVVFKGGVKLDRGGDTMQADQMTTNKDRSKVRAKGHVELFRRLSATETWQGHGDAGFYNTQSGNGYLYGKGRQAHIIRTTLVMSTVTKTMVEQKMDIYANRFDMAQEGPTANAKGRVHGKFNDPESGDIFEFWADQAVHDGKDKKITLTGKSQPRVKQTTKDGTKIMRGNRIYYYLEQKRILSEGRARAVMVDTSGRRSKKKK